MQVAGWGGWIGFYVFLPSLLLIIRQLGVMLVFERLILEKFSASIDTF